MADGTRVHKFCLAIARLLCACRIEDRDGQHRSDEPFHWTPAGWFAQNDTPFAHAIVDQDQLIGAMDLTYRKDRFGQERPGYSRQLFYSDQERRNPRRTTCSTRCRRRAAASKIPKAKLIVADTGGYLLLGRTQEVRAAVRLFLAMRA